MPVTAPVLEIDDVQGILLRGYGGLRASRSLLLELPEDGRARAWLADLRARLTSAGAREGDRAVNVAFTRRGLERLGLPDVAYASFDPAFVEGITGASDEADDGTSHRSRLLGDHGDSAPEHWRWGQRAKPVDGVLLVFARDDAGLESALALERRRIGEKGVRIVAEIEGRRLPGRIEHFGFRDGISQPAIANANLPGERPGVLAPDRPENTVAAGEFLIGQEDAYGQRTFAGLLPADVSGGDRLPRFEPPEDLRCHFGHNGSYLVLRELDQHVQRFWAAVTRAADRAGHDPVWLASRLVGRWPSGAPVVRAPKSDDERLADCNDFGFAALDPDGLLCPHGSHIRRANPRDWLLAPRPRDASELANRHRLIRRGRPYWPALVDPKRPGPPADAAPDGEPRGLQFLCFNASLERQFEFVQSTWLDHRKFGGVRDESDPVLGTLAGGGGRFTLRGSPFPRAIEGLERFVTVRGGAYFFLPGLAAIDWLVRDERRAGGARAAAV